jgi:GntR family transcriptional regulator
MAEDLHGRTRDRRPPRRRPGRESAACHHGGGDQLPKVKDVVAGLAINPNTVLKAYREGLVAARPGIGTFVTGTLDGGSLAAHGPLRAGLRRWLDRARRAGLDDESIEALFASTFRSAGEEDTA